MINNVVLTGRLTKAPDLKSSQSGISLVNFTLAVDHYSKGESKASFIQCVAFRKTADLIADHLDKGALIGIEGRLQTRDYTNNQNQKVYVTEVVVHNVVFLEPKSKREHDSAPNVSEYPRQDKNAAQGKFGGNSDWKEKTQQSSGDSDPFDRSAPIEFTEDDLPFD